jgi:hypothetical protein
VRSLEPAALQVPLGEGELDPQAALVPAEGARGLAREGARRLDLLDRPARALVGQLLVGGLDPGAREAGLGARVARVFGEIAGQRRARCEVAGRVEALGPGPLRGFQDREEDEAERQRESRTTASSLRATYSPWASSTCTRQRSSSDQSARRSGEGIHCVSRPASICSVIIAPLCAER